MSVNRESTFYLILKPGRWNGLKARLTTTQPSLAKDERVMKLKVCVPDAMFAIPTITATVTVPADSVSVPVIDAQVMENVRELLEQKTGLDVNVSLVEVAEAGA